uniref:Xylulose kinase-1 n=1 Tax=Tanacetum cinerariifolium TaxID=118510 RepID=A0A6L2K9Z1_TANCI|nr:xylulose kinase-1 [Tanacetum cinerariifolium]
MVNLEFCNTHNVVTYLEKPEGGEGFHQIVDFLNASHIRYALTENPNIYVSLINQFWETATTRTLDNGEIEITATIDGNVKIVTEASVRRHLKLVDFDDISSLPTTNIFEQLSLMGIPIRQGTEVPHPSSPPHTNVADEAESTGVDVRHGGVAITVTHLDAGQGSGNIDKTPSMTYDSPLLRVNTLISDEGRMQHNELMDFVTKLSDRVAVLEIDLEQTKKVYGADYTKLIQKVKRLVKKDKLRKSRRKLRLVLSDEEALDTNNLALEDPYKQGRKIAQIDEDEGTASTKVKTAGVFVDDTVAETLVYIRRSEEKAKDKGKGIMEESKLPMIKTKRTKLQAKAKRNKPMTQAQQRTYMCSYIKNMGGYTLQQLRGYSFDEIKTLFETMMRRVNTFVPMETEVRKEVPKLVADSSQVAVREAEGSNRAAEEELAGSENRPPMLNKENYVSWSSRLLRYAKSRPNGKLIHDSIINGPYVRRMIPEPGDTNREDPADDQAIQTILLGLPEDIYAAIDSCETA